MKLTLDDKLKIVKLYENGYTVVQLAKKFKVTDSTIKRIERQFREHGLNSFHAKGGNNYYSPNFKYEMVSRIINGEYMSSVAAEIAVNVGMIFSWVKKYNELGYNGLINQKRGRPPRMKSDLFKQTKQNNLELDDKDKEIKELKERNKQLEMENDLLKKLRALVQQRTQQQKKKK